MNGKLVGFTGGRAFWHALKRGRQFGADTCVCHLADGSLVAVGYDDGPGFNPMLYGKFRTSMAYQDAVKAGLMRRVPRDTDW
jgi:hypothetical protein